MKIKKVIYAISAVSISVLLLAEASVCRPDFDLLGQNMGTGILVCDDGPVVTIPIPSTDSLGTGAMTSTC